MLLLLTERIREPDGTLVYRTLYVNSLHILTLAPDTATRDEPAERAMATTFFNALRPAGLTKLKLSDGTTRLVCGRAPDIADLLNNGYPPAASRGRFTTVTRAGAAGRSRSTHSPSPTLAPAGRATWSPASRRSGRNGT